MEVKVSIIIPAYNVEKYIERCVRSAMNQTLKEIEIIVVNDGATDNTKEIIEKLAMENNKIIVINKENGGVSTARNAGLDIAKGEFIQHLDGDDWIEKSALKECYGFAIKNKLDIVICDHYSDDDNGNVKYQSDLKEHQSVFSSEEYLKLFFQDKSYPAIWAKFIRRDIHKNIRNSNDITLAEDLLLTVKLSIKANKIGKLDKAFLHYIFNPNSITKDGREAIKMLDLFKVYEIIKQDMKSKNIYKIYKKGLEGQEIKKINGFFIRKSYWNEKKYLEVVEKIINFLKTKPLVPEDMDPIKKIILRFVIKYPTVRSMKTATFVSYRLLLLKGLIRRIKK